MKLHPIKILNQLSETKHEDREVWPSEKLQKPHERVQRLPSAKKPGLQTWWKIYYRKSSYKAKSKC